LSATSPDHRINQLRLSSARHRIRAFLEQVRYLAASSFPHPDGRDALALIEHHFNRQLERLDLPEDTTPAVVDQVCAHSAMVIGIYTPILGFILRSTNVRNAFEVHHPLKRIVQQLLGKDAKVLISSEWNFVPFTYPMNIDILPKFALLGGPATESNNVLVLPLAGHEIGHSVWRAFGCGDKLQPALHIAIEKIFEIQKEVVKEIISEFGIGALDEFYIKQTILSSGILQLEEIFCDAIGIGLFSHSFLYSYEYFMAPGGGYRSLEYPNDIDRIGYLKEGCAKLSLSIDPHLFTRWSQSKLEEGTDKRHLGLLDQSVAEVASQTIQMALDILFEHNVVLANEESVQRIEASFIRGEPEDEQATIAEVIWAGWNLLRDPPHDFKTSESQMHRFVGELMLKSIEISEFRTRIEGHA
jgi:hypothetical protein